MLFDMNAKRWSFRRAIEASAVAPLTAILLVGIVFWLLMLFLKSAYPELEILASKGHGEYDNVIDLYSNLGSVLGGSLGIAIFGIMYSAVIGLPISFVLDKLGWTNRKIYVIACMSAGTLPVSLLVSFDAFLRSEPIDVLIAAYFYSLFLCTGICAHWYIYGRRERIEVKVADVFE